MFPDILNYYWVLTYWITSETWHIELLLSPDILNYYWVLTYWITSETWHIGPAAPMVLLRRWSLGRNPGQKTVFFVENPYIYHCLYTTVYVPPSIYHRLHTTVYIPGSTQRHPGGQPGVTQGSPRRPDASERQMCSKPSCFSVESGATDHFACTGATWPSRSPQPTHKSCPAILGGILGTLTGGVK